MQKYNTKIKKNTKQVRLRDFYIYTHRNSIITMEMKKKKKVMDYKNDCVVGIFEHYSTVMLNNIFL